MELNVWTGATLNSSKYDDASGKWTLEVTRRDGTKVTLNPSFVVFATGHSGEAVSADVRNDELTKAGGLISDCLLSLYRTSLNSRAKRSSKASFVTLLSILQEQTTEEKRLSS